MKMKTTEEDYKLVAAIVEEHGAFPVLELVAQVCEDLAATSDDQDEADEYDDDGFLIREFLSQQEER